MARKTFISYKYSDVVEGKSNNLRDRIIKAMGEDAKFYNGERVDSPDLTGLKADTIKSNLKDMIFNTSVTIVILSPNMIESKWIPWEIEYSLCCYSRDGRQSKQNGILAVIQKVNGSYDWLQSTSFNDKMGITTSIFDKNKLPGIINQNRFNSVPPKHPCDKCKKYDRFSVCAECNVFDYWNGSYITIANEDDFLADIDKYIKNAFEKSQHLDRFFTKKQVA